MSHWARRIGFTCSMEMMSSLKVVSGAEAFGLIGLRFYRGIIDAAGVLVELMAVFLADQRLDIRFARMRQVSDCADSGLDQFLFGCFSEEQQLAYRKRPHFFGDFFWEQSVYFVWFFEIRCHFGQEFICGDSNIDGKSKLLVNPVLDFVRRRNRVRIQKGSSRHIEEYLIDRKGFHDRGVGGADFLEGTGTPDVEVEITRDNDHVRTFPQCHCHRFTGLDTAFFAGIDFATTIPVRFVGSPPIQAGMSRRSGSPSLIRRTDSQDKKALLTST